MKLVRKILIVITAIFFSTTGCNDSDSPVTPVAEDRTPPNVWFISPPPGVTLADTVSVLFRFTDDIEVDSVHLYKNGNLIKNYNAQVIEGLLEYIWDTTSDSDGVHIWESRAWDNSGNMGQSLSLLVRVANQSEPPPEDRTPPVIEWLFPEINDELSNTIELQILAHDNDRIDFVAVYLNGHPPETWRSVETSDSLYYFDWDTKEYEDGQYLLEARAWDESGNLSVSPTLLVSVRNEFPRVIWVPDEFETIQGAINASEDGDTIRVRAGTYDNGGVRIVKKNVDRK